MKKSPEHFSPRKLGDSLFRVLKTRHFRPGPSLAMLSAFAVSTLVILGSANSGAGSAGYIRDFEAGRVAERDVVAEQSLSYVDEEATRLRMEAQARLVPAVFRFSLPATELIQNGWKDFSSFTENLIREGSSADASRLAIQVKYPAFFSGEDLNTYLTDPEGGHFGEYGATVLNNILVKGIFAIHHTELEPFNPDVAELLSTSGTRTEREQVSYDTVITRENVRNAITQCAAGAGVPAAFASIAANLLFPFISENVFFSPDDTRQRVAETSAQIEPVVKFVEKGKRIIRKGFIITEDDMKELRALNMSLHSGDPRRIIGQILLLILLYGLFIFLGERRMLGRSLSNAEIYLLSVLVSLYLIIAVFARNLSPGLESFPVSMVIPTALVVMLPGILISPRLALVLALALPLGAYLSGSFDAPAYIFALVSGVVASYVLRKAERRMDLVKAGLVIAGANCIAVVVILLTRGAGPAEYPSLLFWAGFNGLVSGMLVLGFLPPLEHVLNTATTFRLIELSDLNSPMLKRLFTAAPGTYSHSIMVANLAEAACQDIGANPLLARVGAYYHDIGKMENPGYFVENQTVYNRHDDTPPRLSATVIRSHVKLGVEKARSLSLPREVIDIIAEHHGNSVIAWFYNKALKQESQVNMEDFTYTGTPPRSRESAVVMLADVTEAAVRTLHKPTAAKMEKFIQTLIDAKVEHGQLAESELTFRDLETIKNAFVRVLAGYYHSRIEYPKLRESAVRETAAKEAGAKETAAKEGGHKEAPAHHAAPKAAAREGEHTEAPVVHAAPKTAVSKENAE
ncbi:MAG: HDIG domain-containing protein [Spirochaetaceae bacterium]|nr:HDIG domain-containing protein [Spirochaetaceae bacterium]